MIQKEKTLAPAMTPILLIAAFSGYITQLITGHYIWEQWIYLMHSLASIALTFLFIPYSVVHFRRTSGTRRPIVSITGFITACLVYALILTGLQTLIQGQIEALRWVYTTHIYISYLIPLLLGAHLLLHRFSKPGKSLNTRTTFTFLGKKDGRRCIKALLISSVIIVALAFIHEAIPDAYTIEPVVSPYEYPYGDHPFRPSQNETVGNKFIDKRQLAGSDKCGACHKQIFDEWSSSIHSQAASDKSYVTNISLLADKKGLASTRYCEGCHSPVALMSGQLTKGGTHGGTENTLAFHEGVGCMSCHGIDNISHLKGVASYIFKPQKDYLFASSTHILSTKLTNFLIRIHPDEHRLDMARPVIKTTQVCATCHVQFMDKDMNDWGWVKMQDEYTAWLNSQYSGQKGDNFNNQTIQRCQDCHFPLVSGVDPSADNNQMIVSHRSLGSNTAIPWLNRDQQQLKATTRFLQADKIRVDIDLPWRKDATQSEKYINSKNGISSQTPYYLYLGEQADINVTVSNLSVGHNFPGGTTDINEVWIEIIARDAENNVIYSSGNLDADNNVEEQAYFYRTIAVDRFGKHVWKHDLFNMVGDSYKNVIPPGKSDVVNYSFLVPYWVKSSLTVTATVRYRKFNNQYSRWALQDENINLPITDIARAATSINIRKKPEAAQ